MIKGIVFDKDGTLYDFTKTWAGWCKTAALDLSNNNPKLASELSALIGFDFNSESFTPDSMFVSSTPFELATTISNALPEYTVESLLHKMQSYDSEVNLQEAVNLKEFLTKLKDRNLRIGLLTKDSELNAREHLRETKIDIYFDMIVGFDSGFEVKPSPEALLHFSTKFNLTPSEVLMVGDSVDDLLAGRNAGMKSVGVLTGSAPKENLEPYADYIFDNISGILNLLVQDSR